MDASYPPSFSDSNIDSQRDEDAWDEIVDEDFSENEDEFSTSCSGENGFILLPAALSAPPRRVWKVLADRLAESSFEARLVDPEQRKLNEAATKKRYQLDPTKRHNVDHQMWPPPGCWLFQPLRARQSWLFAKEGFPIYIRLDELSAKDVRFVVDRLGVPLRGRLEAQLSAKQSAEQIELPNDGKGNQKVQGLFATIPEQETTSEGLRCVPHAKCRGWRDGLGHEAADHVAKAGEFMEKERKGGCLHNKSAHPQPLRSHPTFDTSSASEEAVLKGKGCKCEIRSKPSRSHTATACCSSACPGRPGCFGRAKARWKNGTCSAREQTDRAEEHSYF